MLHDTVKKVAMRNPHTLAVGQGVNIIFLDLDFSEAQADELSDTFVMIARYENNAGTFAALA